MQTEYEELLSQAPTNASYMESMWEWLACLDSVKSMKNGSSVIIDPTAIEESLRELCKHHSLHFEHQQNVLSLCERFSGDSKAKDVLQFTLKKWGREAVERDEVPEDIADLVRSPDGQEKFAEMLKRARELHNIRSAITWSKRKNEENLVNQVLGTAGQKAIDVIEQMRGEHGRCSRSRGEGDR